MKIIEALLKPTLWLSTIFSQVRGAPRERLDPGFDLNMHTCSLIAFAYKVNREQRLHSEVMMPHITPAMHSTLRDWSNENIDRATKKIRDVSTSVLVNNYPDKKIESDVLRNLGKTLLRLKRTINGLDFGDVGKKLIFQQAYKSLGAAMIHRSADEDLSAEFCRIFELSADEIEQRLDLI